MLIIGISTECVLTIGKNSSSSVEDSETRQMV